MSTMTYVLAVLMLLGAGLIAGVFFAFSSFIMPALKRIEPESGIAAMQSINVVVLNRSFLGVFMGTTVLSVVLVILTVIGRDMPAAPFLLCGALLYFVGTFLVTGLGNVPLNNQLAAVDADGPDATSVWNRYLERWTRLNTLRSFAAAAAALTLTLGLMAA